MASFGCKNEMNFLCNTTKFHNYHHNKQEPTIRSMGPLQPEQGSSVVTSTSGPGPNENQGNTGSLTNVSSPPRVVLWTRLPGRIYLTYIQILIKMTLIEQLFS